MSVIRKVLAKAAALLEEASEHLDRDYNWEAAGKYEQRIKNLLEEIDFIARSEHSYATKRDPR